MIHILKPNNEGIYWAKQSQSFLGLWTPYGNIIPYVLAIDSYNRIEITYLIHKTAKFTKLQKKKNNYIKKHGVGIDLMYIENTDS